MFKHVLIPIDGSPASNRAAKAGIAFAGRLGAKVTAYYALEALDPVWNEGYRLDKTAIGGFEVGARKAAQRRLDALGRTAKLAGVPYASAVTKVASASEGIIDAAKKQKCDVIFIASHGHRGLVKLLLGSVTQKVLSRSRIPVLMYR